jgi:1-pyrroline-5-carboxylate dehydrogenase
LWEATIKRVKADLADMKMGGVEDFTNFINAVIDEKSFDKLASFIERAKADGQEIVAGGKYDKSKGYFIEPTIIRANDPQYITMCEELFGPVFTVYVYEDDKYEEILDTCDRTSIYALTGAVIAQDRYAIDLATERLRHAAGNFYINDKPTGAVVGQQPFGGARGSGTNDKAGSMLNLIRWVSARTVKENLNPPKSYRYPFQG